MSERSEVAALIERLGDGSALVIGDVMLDHFVYGRAERISPEAPIPVFAIERESDMLGGAGNTARNVASLGARTGLVAVIGDDATGERIASLTRDSGIKPLLLTDPSRVSTEKRRYIASGQQLLRADREQADRVTETLESRLAERIADEATRYGALVLSDYGKGLLSDAVIRAAIEAAKICGIPVVVDPKRRDFSVYAGAFLLAPNAKEMAEAAGRQLPGEAAIEAAAREQMSRHDIAHIVVTRGAQGMLLVSADPAIPAIAVPARAREVFDVSGAGDTVAATLAVALSIGAGPAEAVELANLAAGIVVGRLGTSTVYRTDLKAALHLQGVADGSRKIQPRSIAAEQVAHWRQDGLKVGFTNGCFDIVHAGHMALINDARAECDRLVLAINSDDSVKRLKGETRPINPEMDRALLLAELPTVDLVVIFREDTPEELLHILKPDVLMKGADYEISGIVGAEFVTGYGGSVKRIPLREGYSSTNVIEKIRRQG